MTRRPPWLLAVAAGLLVLLATLATLQYRWLGAVSEAERERMRVGLRARTADFTREFDAELTRTYVALHVDNDRVDVDGAAALAEAFERWRSSTSTPALVRDIYLAEGQTFDDARVRRFDPQRKTLETAEWPADLAASLKQTSRMLPQLRGRFGGAPPALMMADAVDSRIPALIIALPRVARLPGRSDGRQLTIFESGVDPRVVVIVLNADVLRDLVLAPLVVKHFGEAADSDYVVTVARRDEPAIVVFTSGEGPVEAAAADVTSGMFDLRMDELSRLADANGHGREGSMLDQRVAITIVRRANGAEGKRILMAGGDDQGAWQVRVRHRSGSLDAIVAQSRRRNLAISLGVLGLLAASVVLILGAAQRQQRLARQQLEFVAAVSHELRTPLAVICSAGENLADGVVADAPQVRRYGTVISSEGRRLRDMVERVLEFAGVASGAPPRPHTNVDVARVIADAVGAVGGEARERGIEVHLHSNGSLPAVRGDAEALRSAVENVVGNAVKYSAPGGSVDVHAEQQVSQVQIRVADRGLGIDADDLPHVFKPFHRGRRAVDAQIRGTGVGLSVVRHVVAAHHGEIRVQSKPGEGTTVTIALPVSDTSLTPV